MNLIIKEETGETLYKGNDYLKFDIISHQIAIPGKEGYKYFVYSDSIFMSMDKNERTIVVIEG